MPPKPTDLGPERPDCPGRFHGTYNAALRGGCICPSAKATYLQRRQVYKAHEREREREGALPRRLDLDPIAVDQAIDGELTAAQLTTAELKRVVAHLAGVRHMSDREIAVHLHWSDDPERARANVCRFRRHHRIPSGVPSTYWPPIRAAAAA